MNAADLLALAERCERAMAPDRILDAEAMFDLYAKPVGEHEDDGGPIGYLWPEDNASWAFGHRFPGKDREWAERCRRGIGDETLTIQRDGALVLMNSLRIPPLTASLDAAMTLVPEGWRVSRLEEDWRSGRWHGQLSERTSPALLKMFDEGRTVGWNTADTEPQGAASAPLALTAAALRAHAAIASKAEGR